MEVSEAVKNAGVSLGYDDLREEQTKVLCPFVEGREVFVPLPTGFGKSLCYVLLPLVFDSLKSRSEADCKSIVVVVSLLIALMEDQVSSYSANGIRSAFIDSESDIDTQTSVISSGCQIVLFSPEALISNRRWRNMLQDEPTLAGLLLW